MLKSISCIFLLFSVSLFQTPAFAHYGMLIPSSAMVNVGDSKSIEFQLSFSHPFEQLEMELVRPQAFQVFHEGKSQDILSSLKRTEVMGQTGWKADYRLKRPGVYSFLMEPKPYWEEAEDSYIIHYTKTVIGAFGDEEGWDAEVGAITEIVPLVRPFGLYKGNLFGGIVKINGVPAPFAEIEVEFYNQKGLIHAASPFMITQKIKADQNGVFYYSVPHAGWWGFAALHQADYQISHQGVPKPVELGAVLWLEFIEWNSRD